MTEVQEQIEAAAYPILFVPFHGTPIPVKIRELTQAQILACGNFSLIETLEDKILSKTKKCKIRDVIAYAERNHNIVKAALLSPTYDQIFEIIGKNPAVEDAREKLKDLKVKLQYVKKSSKRSAVEEEIDCMRIQCSLILPNDFMSYIVAYALGIDKSDIKDISENILIDAAILATRGNDNPANHIDGRFTPFMKDDINRRAWILFEKKKKELR